MNAAESLLLGICKDIIVSGHKLGEITERKTDNGRIDELARIRMMVRSTRVDDTSVSLPGSSRGVIVPVIVGLRITGTSGILRMKNRDIRASLCILTHSEHEL
jgi:hypothetical protein